MLPMLTLSGAAGLVYLNGRFCGETGAAAIPLARDGVQYLELRPFDPAQRGAVLKLKFEGGRLVAGAAGDAFAVQWPGGWVAMELRGDPGALEEEAPVLLSQIQMPGGQYLLVSEGGVPSFGRSAEEAVFLPVDGVEEASLRALPYPGLCVAEGVAQGGAFAAVLRADGAPELLQHAQGASVRLDGQGALYCTETAGDLVGHATECVYVPDAQGRYALRSRDAAWADGEPHWPHGARETALAWLEALRYGAQSEAMGYVLRPIEAERLAQVAGDFASITELPPDGGEDTCWGVIRMDSPNMATVRRLSFTMARQPSAQGDWKIAEVAERDAIE
ncbi:MAG: hypothetical protein LBN04_05590 [Oscillospiraceae bacterium]|nr:hypothetical protein [Oscillospiraceae bacterium]